MNDEQALQDHDQEDGVGKDHRRIVAICSSMASTHELMIDVAARRTGNDNIVLFPFEVRAPYEQRDLDALQRDRIAMADEVIFVISMEMTNQFKQIWPTRERWENGIKSLTAP